MDSKRINKFADSIGAKISSFINDCCTSAMELATSTNKYTIADLDTKINPDETLREYILDGISEFGLPSVDFAVMTDEELRDLLATVDDCWRAVL